MSSRNSSGISILAIGFLLIVVYFTQYQSELQIDKTNRDLWYGLYWNNNKVGYFNQQWLRTSEQWVWHQKMSIAGRVRGENYRYQSNQSLDFSTQKPFLLQSGYRKIIENGRIYQKRFQIRGKNIHIWNNGIKTTNKLSHVLTAEELSNKGSTSGSNSDLQQLTISQWDMDNLRVQKYKLTKNGHSGKEIQWNQNSPIINGNAVWMTNEEGIVVSRKLSDQFSYKLMDENSAKTQNFMAPLNQHQFVPVDKPLGDFRNIKSIELALSGSGSGVITKAPSDSFLQFEDNKVEKVSIEDDINKLSKMEYLIIKQLLQDHISSELSEEKKVSELVHFVSDYVENSTNLHQPSLTEILKDPRGDCTEHSLLFITMAREMGLQARMVNGLIYLGDKQQKYQAHVWAEVKWNNQWHSVDPTWDRTELDARYIRFNMKNAATYVSLLATSNKFLTLKSITYEAL